MFILLNIHQKTSGSKKMTYVLQQTERRHAAEIADTVYRELFWMEFSREPFGFEIWDVKQNIGTHGEIWFN